MAENSLRTLCLGYKKLTARDDLEAKDAKGIFECEKEGIVLVAIIGVRDIPRKEVPEAIRQCHKAGITVRMVTGDNIITAKAIAKDIGITKDGTDFLALEGPEFNRLVGGVVCKNCRTAVCDCPTDSKKAEETGREVRVDTVANGEEFDKIQDKLLVLARSRPEDKYCLVTALKERGNVVAVTGDGTNDAPALKKADVGFAMGQSGTEVARDAAAIILIDDNFSSIVKAVLWGRNIYDSIRKFVQFQLTVNVVAVAITLIGAALLEKEVLKPIQMLWVNLIMDTLASLALATEEPTDELLNRHPHSRDEYIISSTMLKHIVGQSIFQLIILLVLIFYGEQFIPEYTDSYDSSIFALHPEYKWLNGVVGGTVRSGRFYTVTGGDDYVTVYNSTLVYSRHFTFIFNTFVLLQVFNFLNARKLHEEFNIFEGITRNPLFLIIVGGIFGLQILLVTFTGSAFGVYDNYGLTVEQWLITVGLGSLSLIVNFLLKLLPIGKAGHLHE
jgi:P-type Ca2+ transporter type 2B